MNFSSTTSLISISYFFFNLCQSNSLRNEKRIRLLVGDLHFKNLLFSCLLSCSFTFVVLISNINFWVFMRLHANFPWRRINESYTVGCQNTIYFSFSSRNFVIPLAPPWVLPNGLCVGSRASNITQSSCVSARKRPLNAHFYFQTMD